MKKTILLGLNELNFDYIKFYINNGELKTFKALFEEYNCVETISENKYELLEPWIQWVTISTGKTYEEHKVFRLGDIKDRSDLKQIFEIVEEKGLSVGAISPFNVDNRLKNPLFFVSDPWTKTKNSGSWLLKKLGKAISQTVNDNAQGKVSKFSGIYILLGLLFYVKISAYPTYLSIIKNIKKKGSKAVILDKLLGDVFISQWKKNKPDFSNLFLNTGAHFQHHYMFNSAAYDGPLSNPEWYCPSNQDPLLMILKEYDKIIEQLMQFDVRLVIVTGLHQKPHGHNTFYWRLKNHDDFIKNQLEVDDYKKIIPRMSRDFLIEFEDEVLAIKCQKKLESLISISDGVDIFTVDNRGKSLFVELTYPNEITEDFKIAINNDVLIDNFKSHIAFVAIKNGEHDGIGYYIDTMKEMTENVKEGIPLKNIFFNLQKPFKV